MTTRNTQPSLADLTNRLLKASAVDAADVNEPEVEPFEVLNGFRTDPRTAYTDAILSLKLLGVTGLPVALPPEWAALVQQAGEATAVPMAAGQFPQRVRDLTALLSAERLESLQPQASEPASGFHTLRNWVKKQQNVDGLKWLAAGASRLLGDAATTDADGDAVAANERATDLWLSGRRDEAVAAWKALPDSPVAAFNRGMGLLFTGHAAEAVPHLRAAATGLSDTCGWSHLAKLYLAVAESR